MPAAATGDRVIAIHQAENTPRSHGAAEPSPLVLDDLEASRPAGVAD
jgi:hypothetical protein